MNKLESLIEAKRLIDSHDESPSFDEYGFFITPHWHHEGLRVTIHGMAYLSNIALKAEGGELVLEEGNPTKEQQKVIDRVNEIMKEDI